MSGSSDCGSSDSDSSDSDSIDSDISASSDSSDSDIRQQIFQITMELVRSESTASLAIPGLLS